MNSFALIVLLSAVPLILLLFATLPPRRALTISYVAGWMFLPTAGFVVVGLPDFTKVTACTFGTLLGALVFDLPGLLRFRPRWFDLPILVFCGVHFVTHLANGLTAYDGFSSSLFYISLWGIPYFLGRVYLNDLEALRGAAVAIIYGALVYVPFCLYEMRMSPTLARQVYGVIILIQEPPRWGLGYRPTVFMDKGLATGLWMCFGALSAYWLWTTGALRRVWGFAPGQVVAALVVVAFLCKSLGAIILMGVGAGVLWLTRRTKSPAFVLALLLTPTLYMSTRVAQLWTGRQVVEWTRAVDVDRAISLEVRLSSEDVLAEKAMQRPWLGWGGFSRSRVFDEQGKDVSITDGFWVILLGVSGVVGLASSTLLFLLPGLTLLRRYPVRTWGDPDVAAAAVLVVTVALNMVDNLSNAMYNPVYMCLAGGIVGLEASRGRGRSGRGAAGLSAPGLTPPEGAAPADEHALAEAVGALEGGLASGAAAPPGGLEALPELYAALAGRYLARDQGVAAVDCLRRAADLRRALAAGHPGDPDHLRGLGVGLEDLGRAAWAAGRYAEGEEAWLASLEVRRGLAEAAPGRPELTREWADALNDLAWLLAREPRPGSDDPHRAARLAAQALDLDPGGTAYWNTLGVARLRAGDWAGAASALGRSLELTGGTAFDHYAISVAMRHLGEPERALAHFRLGDEWAAANPGHPELALFRAEAAGPPSLA